VVVGVVITLVSVGKIKDRKWMDKVVIVGGRGCWRWSKWWVTLVREVTNGGG
jgi:hypothetical protein